MNASLLIENAMLLQGDVPEPGWVAVQADRIAAIGPGSAPEAVEAAERIDAEGAWLLPGAIDEHVHFRDPGLTHKADISTESRAAVAGGVTSFIDMPNTVPQTVSRQAVEEKMQRASEVSAANYAFYIGATADNFDELRHADYSRIAGVKLFLGSSTGNMLLDDPEQIARLFTEVPALFAVHAESDKRISAKRKELTALYPSADGDLPIALHPAVRDRRACYEAAADVARLARLTGARLHILHISTADELSLLDPLDPRVSGETCPQYLEFCDRDYERLGARIKCNPAIKEAADREALRRAVAEGRIATVATDHAPHLLCEKEGGALKAVSGMPMIQFSLPLMLTLADEGAFSHARVVDAMASGPARIYGIEGRGRLAPGYYADMALLRRDEYTVSDTDATSRCGWTPLAGRRLGWRVASTWVNGRRVFDGTRITDNPPGGRPLRFIR